MQNSTLNDEVFNIKYKTVTRMSRNKLKLVLEPINKSESMELLLKLAVLLSKNRRHSGLKLYNNKRIELVFNLENNDDINELVSLDNSKTPVLNI
jgi:hypothetical protein